MRVGEVEREAASSALAEHYASGRLTMDEYYERLDAAWSAHVRADLDMLFDDLPHGAVPTPPDRPARSGRRPRPVRTIVVLVLLIVAALMVMGVPWWVPLAVAGGLVLLTKRHHHHHHGHHHGHHRCG
ncbi:MAG: DUF1707 domain-containing protein [Nocardioides sp.]|nr:DUF1707 domain-containing protein [Nocardioides sp.]